MDKIEKLQELVNQAHNIVFFGGAGVSTESGIKDFRGKNGLYKEKQDNDLPPEYMLSHSCLVNEPELFFHYYKSKMNSLSAKPNVTHKYLKILEDCGKLKAIITQNIDGLHQLAGSKNVLEIHGTIHEAYCMKCFKKYDGKYIFNSDGIPRCDCGGIIRPKVILYEEQLPDEFFWAMDYLKKADLLIVAGTSLTVEPASSLIREYIGKKLVIINMDQTPYDDYATLVIHESLKNVFSQLK